MNIRKSIPPAERKERMGKLMNAVLEHLRQAGEPVGLLDLAARTSPDGDSRSPSHYASVCRAVGLLKRRCEVVIDMAPGGPGRLVVRLADMPAPSYVRLPLDGADVEQAVLEILAGAAELNAERFVRISDPRSLLLSLLNDRVVKRLARSKADVPRVRTAAARAVKRLSAKGLVRRSSDPITGAAIVVPVGTNVD